MNKMDYRDKALEKYIKLTRLELYHSGDFVRKFYWNVPAITENSSVKSGFIVQHIIRKTYTPSEYSQDKQYNHSYWEAWPVKNDKVDLQDIGYHDQWSTPLGIWSIMPESGKNYTIHTHAKDKKDSYGIISMEGYVYWAPDGSDLAEIVTSTFQENHVEWASELAAAYEDEVPDMKQFPIIFAHTFSHLWHIDEADEAEDYEYASSGVIETY